MILQRIAVALKNLFIPCRDSVNCNFITESRHGINKFFNATAILCKLKLGLCSFGVAFSWNSESVFKWHHRKHGIRDFQMELQMAIHNCVGKLFSHSLQSLIQSMRMGTRLCEEWENNFPTQLKYTVLA